VGPNRVKVECLLLQVVQTEELDGKTLRARLKGEFHFPRSRKSEGTAKDLLGTSIFLSKRRRPRQAGVSQHFQKKKEPRFGIPHCGDNEEKRESSSEPAKISETR